MIGRGRGSGKFIALPPLLGPCYRRYKSDERTIVSRINAIGAMLALLLPMGLEAAGPILPRWSLGDRWTVKTIHRGLRLGRGKLGPEEKGPETTTYWMYKVTRVKVVKGDVYYVVSVKDKDGRVPAGASLIFCRMHARKDREGKTVLPRLALVKGKFVHRRAGEAVQSSKDFCDRPNVLPVLGDMSTIPHDFPVFPIGAVDAPAEAGALLEQLTYEITEGNDELRFARDIRQSVSTCPDPKTLGGAELARWFEAEGHEPKNCLLVELARPFDGARVLQIWNELVPWPLWSKGPWSTSRLVLYSSASRLRGSSGELIREGRLKEPAGDKGPPLDERGRPPAPF